MRGILKCGLSFLPALLVLNSLILSADLPLGLEKLKGEKSQSGAQELKEMSRWNELPSAATSLVFSNDQKILALGLKDQIQLMDLSTKVAVETISLKSGQVRSLSYSPDGTQLLAGSYQKATLIDTKTNKIVREFSGHRGYVTGVAFSPDGQRIATACEDELARVWSLKDESPAITLKGHGYPVTGVAWSADGNQLATSAGDDTRPTKPGQVRIWDSQSGMLKNQFELHQKAATGVAFTPDGRFLLSTSIDEHVNVYDLTNDKPLGFYGGHSRPTNAVVIHPDGETAISISGGRAVGKNELFAWEIETGETLAGAQAHDGKVLSLAISKDGRIVATGGQDRTVALWNFGFLSVGLPESTTSNQPAAGAAVAVQTQETNQTAVAKADKADPAKPQPKQLRAGIIGLDTSHAIAFTKTLNANPAIAGAEGIRVVAAYPKGSPDIPSSVERVPKYIEEIKTMGVEIVDSIDELLKRVDVVLLETNDGRPHFEQLLPCLKAGKPTFIDKPVAASLSDAIAIYEAAKKYQVPVFSSSSLRFGATSQAVRGGSIGKVTKADTTSPASIEATHPDLFWYGIHGVESLFTVMGKGCQSVVRGKSPEGKLEVTGQWSDGRVGTYREAGGYVGKAVGEKGEADVGTYDGYNPLVFEIVKFFQTGTPPVSVEETLEIYAFMEAADESKRQNGASVTLESVMAKARVEAAKKLAALK